MSYKMRFHHKDIQYNVVQIQFNKFIKVLLWFAYSTGNTFCDTQPIKAEINIAGRNKSTWHIISFGEKQQIVVL